MEIPKHLASGEMARLIPASADSSKKLRAVSILLATMSIVPQFRRVMLESIGIRFGVKSSLDCFSEITFQGDAHSKSRPDGLWVLNSGKGKKATCLIEAKIKNENIDKDQIEKYIQVAKRKKIDSLLRISNQFIPHYTHSPFNLSKSATKCINLFHWSWMHVITIATIVLFENDCDCSEQKYILSEWLQ